MDKYGEIVTRFDFLDYDIIEKILGELRSEDMIEFCKVSETVCVIVAQRFLYYYPSIQQCSSCEDYINNVISQLRWNTSVFFFF